MTDLDPTAVEGLGELAACLRQLHAQADKPTYRELEHRTIHVSGKLPGSTLDRVPLRRSTISDVLAGRKFPRKAFLLTFIEACGVDVGSDRRWEQVWNRLAARYQSSADSTRVEQLRGQVTDLRQQVTVEQHASPELPAAHNEDPRKGPPSDSHQDIRASIAAALYSRRARREPIARLRWAWRALIENTEAMVATLGETSAQFATLHQLTPAQTAVAREVDAERSEDIQEIRQAIAELTPAIDSVESRISRNTINIGVIGRAKSGKSTLIRSITGLSDQIIPAGNFGPTTATRSRILHSPGRATAIVTLYTWEEFCSDYLIPLHRRAGCADLVPQTPDTFASYNYETPEGSDNEEYHENSLMSRRHFLELLRVAQYSFPSYHQLLTGPNRLLTFDRLSELGPYLAYPDDPSDQRRLYHAVRDVSISCQFRDTDVENLILIDLPATGESGADIDHRYLQGLENDVDVLLQVKRADASDPLFSELSWSALDLADEVRMGVAWRDFVSIVINTDPSHLDSVHIQNGVGNALNIAKRNGLRLLAGDVADPSDARDQILGPVLRSAAGRLAAMDYQAASTTLTRASDVATRAAVVADRLLRQADQWQEHTSNEDRVLRAKVVELNNQVARALHDLRAQYSRRPEGCPMFRELEEAIASAKRQLIAWAEAGFGHGSYDQWLTAHEPSMVADPGETVDDAYALIRQKIRNELRHIDSSAAAAVGRFRLEVAELLRKHLGLTLVPFGDQPLNDLLEKTRQPDLKTLRSALEELLAFHVDGNIYSRVSGPVVQQIHSQSALHHMEVSSAGGLHRALMETLRQAVDQVEERMRAETDGLAETLAWTTDQFSDQINRSPDVLYELAVLCAPVRRELWPDVFNEQTTELSTALKQIIGAATGVREASRQIGVIVAYLEILGN